MAARKRGLLLAALAVIVAVAAAALLSSTPSPRSSRLVAVEQLLKASRAGDDATFAALVKHDGEFFPNFDVISTISPEGMREFIRECKAQRFAEGLDTVAVQFDCSRDGMGRFYVDFTFCGDRISRVSWPEFGRWMLSPIVDDLFDRMGGDPCRRLFPL